MNTFICAEQVGEIDCVRTLGCLLLEALKLCHISHLAVRNEYANSNKCPALSVFDKN